MEKEAKIILFVGVIIFINLILLAYIDWYYLNETLFWNITKFGAIINLILMMLFGIYMNKTRR